MIPRQIAASRQALSASYLAGAGVRVHRSVRLVSLALLWLALPWLAGCGSPSLHDVDGRPLPQPLMRAPIEGGWVAVDTSGGQNRAVLELQTESETPDVRPWDLASLELRLADESVIKPKRLICADPRCCPEPAGPLECPQATREVAVGEQATAAEKTRTRCVHIVRAEFLLPRALTSRDSVTLVLGESISLLRWRR